MGQITFKENGSITFKDGSITFLSYPPMAEPTVIASWNKIGEEYKSWVSITNNDTQTARIYFRTNGSDWIYADLPPDETTIRTTYDSDTWPDKNTPTTGEAYATDLNDLRPSSAIVEDIKLSPWNPDMANPEVIASWVFAGTSYNSKVSITNMDTRTADITYWIDNSSTPQYVTLTRSANKTIVTEHSSWPIVGTEAKGKAQATDPNGVRPPSNIVEDTALSPWNPSMTTPEVTVSWIVDNGIYKSRVSIKNNDALTANIWYRINEYPEAGDTMVLSAGENRIFIVSEIFYAPALGTWIKAEAQATDPLNKRPSSSVITRTATSTWGPTMATPAVTVSLTKSGTNYVSKVSIKNNDTQTATIYYQIHSGIWNPLSFSAGQTKTIEIESNPFSPPSGSAVTVKAYAKDPNNSKNQSETRTHTAYW